MGVNLHVLACHDMTARARPLTRSLSAAVKISIKFLPTRQSPSGMKLAGGRRCERVDRHSRWIAKGGYFKG